MSVLIKGMKMPGSCRKCQVMVGTFCQILNIDVDPFYDGETRRNRKCPLVEIPEKHGRLIDADELWERMLKYTDNEGAKFPYGDDDSLIHRDSACFMIENAATIIEAEGAEE